MASIFSREEVLNHSKPGIIGVNNNYQQDKEKQIRADRLGRVFAGDIEIWIE